MLKTEGINRSYFSNVMVIFDNFESFTRTIKGFFFCLFEMSDYEFSLKSRFASSFCSGLVKHFDTTVHSEVELR